MLNFIQEFTKPLRVEELVQPVLEMDIEKVASLLKKREAKQALVQSVDKHGNTILHYACKAIAHDDYFSQYYDQKSGKISTEKFIAFEKKLLLIIHKLIDSGADVNQENAWKETPLLIAAGHSRSASVVELLLKHNAKLKACDKDGENVLHKAAGIVANYEVIQCLIKHAGSEAEFMIGQKNMMGKNSLHWAVLKTSNQDQFATFTCLLGQVPELDSNRLKTLSYTSLLKEAIGEPLQQPPQPKMVSIILQEIRKRAPKNTSDLELRNLTKEVVNNYDDKGNTPLHYAVMYAIKGKYTGEIKAILQLLLRAGAYMLAVNNQEVTPLALAEANFELKQDIEQWAKQYYKPNEDFYPILDAKLEAIIKQEQDFHEAFQNAYLSASDEQQKVLEEFYCRYQNIYFSIFYDGLPETLVSEQQIEKDKKKIEELLIQNNFEKRAFEARQADAAKAEETNSDRDCLVNVGLYYQSLATRVSEASMLKPLIPKLKERYLAKKSQMDTKRVAKSPATAIENVVSNKLAFDETLIAQQREATRALVYQLSTLLRIYGFRDYLFAFSQETKSYTVELLDYLAVELAQQQSLGFMTYEHLAYYEQVKIWLDDHFRVFAELSIADKMTEKQGKQEQASSKDQALFAELDDLFHLVPLKPDVKFTSLANGLLKDAVINLKYEYEDYDINLLLELAKQLDANQKPAIEIVAAVDSVYPQQLEQRLKEASENSQGETLLLLPYNIGGFHWIGLMIVLDDKKCLKRAFCFDPLGMKQDIVLVLNQGLQKVFPLQSQVKFENADSFRQFDTTSCGPLTVEGLLSLVQWYRQGADMPLAFTIYTQAEIMQLREKHLLQIKQYRPQAFDAFYQKQEKNHKSFGPLAAQIQRLVHPVAQQNALKEKDALKIDEIIQHLNDWQHEKSKVLLVKSLQGLPLYQDKIHLHLQVIRDAFSQVVEWKNDLTVVDQKRLERLLNLFFGWTPDNQLNIKAAQIQLEYAWMRTIYEALQVKDVPTNSVLLMTHLLKANPIVRDLHSKVTIKIKTSYGEKFKILEYLTEQDVKALYLQAGVIATVGKAQGGKGHFGVVNYAKTYCKNQKGYQYVAVKMISDPEKMERCEKEDEIHVELQLKKIPHIIPFFVSTEHKGVRYQFMHLAGIHNGWKLKEYIEDAVDQNKITSDEANKIWLHTLKSLLEALKGMHEIGIPHMDMSTWNFVADKAGHVYLIDFGCATKFPVDNPTVKQPPALSDLCCYSELRFYQYYLSLQKDKPLPSLHLPKEDVFALGLVFARLVLNLPWFSATECKKMLNSDKWDTRKFSSILAASPRLTEAKENTLEAVIRDMLTLDETKRPMAKELLAYPILRETVITEVQRKNWFKKILPEHQQFPLMNKSMTDVVISDAEYLFSNSPQLFEHHSSQKTLAADSHYTGMDKIQPLASIKTKIEQKAPSLESYYVDQMPGVLSENNNNSMSIPTYRPK